MKQAILLLALLIALPAMASTPTYVQSDGSFQVTTAASTQTDTLTHTSTSGNWVIAFISWKTTTSHLTYVCGGTSCTQNTATCFFFPYTQQVSNGTAHSSQIWIGANCSAISAITVKWSANTLSDTQVEEYSGVSSVGQVTSATGTSTTPSVTITIQDANNIVAMVTSSPYADGVPTSNTGNLRDASRSATGGDAGSACDNTSASAGTAVTCKVTITSSTWTAQGVELRSTTASNADHVESFGPNTPGGNETGTLTSITTNLVSDPFLSGNTAVCWVTYPTSATLSSAVTLSTFTGSTVDTLTADKTVTGANNKLGIYRVAATAGVQYVKWTFSSALSAPPNFASGCSEFYNITTSSPVDVSCGTASETTATQTCGSMTTNVDDVIFYVSVPDNTPGGDNQNLGYCAAGSGYTVLLGNVVTPYCMTYTVDNSPGATNPSLYFPGVSNASISMNTAGVAYKVSAGGTAPPSSGIYVPRAMVILHLGATYIYGNCASSGNMNSATLSNYDGTTAYEKVFDSNQDSYTTNTPSLSTDGSFNYSTNSSLDASSMCMFYHRNTGNTDEVVIRDIAGTATSSPVDGLSGACPSPSTFGSTGCYNFESGTAGSGNANLPNIQPSAASELVIAALQLGTGPPSNITAPSGAIVDCPYYSGMTDASWNCSGEGHGHFYSTGTGALNWTYTLVNTTGANGVAWAIKPQPAGAAVLPQVFVIRPGEAE